MFSLFSNPIKKLEKKQEFVIEQAMHAQKIGNTALYAKLTEQAQNLDKEILKLKEQAKQKRYA